jgi:hypothetical protein
MELSVMAGEASEVDAAKTQYSRIPWQGGGDAGDGKEADRALRRRV